MKSHHPIHRALWSPLFGDDYSPSGDDYSPSLAIGTRWHLSPKLTGFVPTVD